MNIWQLDMATGAAQQYIASTQSESSPQYSPDGSRVAFRSNRSGHNEIWVAESSAPSNPTQRTKIGGALTGCPRWSPDSKRIACDARPDGPPDIFVVDAATGEAKRITTESSEDVTPSWSHDGAWVYFASNRDGTFQVWKAPSNGGAAVQVTKQGGFSPFESPDGQYVYYAKGRTVPGLWRVPVNGGVEEVVLSHLKPGYWGYWQICDGSVYFADKESPRNPAALFQYVLSTGKLTRLHDLEKPPIVADAGLAISPDCRTALYSQRDQSGSDIFLVDLR